MTLRPNEFDGVGTVRLADGQGLQDIRPTLSRGVQFPWYGIASNSYRVNHAKMTFQQVEREARSPLL